MENPNYVGKVIGKHTFMRANSSKTPRNSPAVAKSASSQVPPPLLEPFNPDPPTTNPTPSNPKPEPKP